MDVDSLSSNFYELVAAFYQAPLYHLLLEGALVLWILRLVFIKSYTPKRDQLTSKEKEELIREWNPEPLVPPTPADHPALHVKTIEGPAEKYVLVDGKKRLNLATFNFLGLVGNKKIEDVSVKAIEKYGVGSCGPRGFYGTMDAHLDIEERLAKFMAVEEAVLYSFGFATISSAIPAYAKRSDVIFCDEGVNFAIQKGILASRAHVKYFHHNDMNHLKELLDAQAADDRKNPKKATATRRFLVVEGLYLNYGDLCPLSELVEFKFQYKVRIFLDESLSFGTVGETGRGVTEHYKIPVNHIDCICGSLEYSLASIGGFSCGSSFVVDHQRLSGLGYCFSASLPPLLARAAVEALNIIEQNPDMIFELKKKCKSMHQELKKVAGIKVISDESSPIQHLQLAKSTGNREKDSALLQRIVDALLEKDVLLTQARYLDGETHLPPPSIRLAINLELTEDEISSAISHLRNAVHAILLN